MKRLLAVCFVGLLLTGCANQPKGNYGYGYGGREPSMTELNNWPFDCARRDYDVPYLKTLITTPDSRLRAMVFFDPNSAAKQSRQWDGVILTILSTYQTQCPGGKFW